MKKLFTLIELIVVIVILGVLAAIVIPNISGWQKEAEYTAVQSNLRNLQTSVDMYALDQNGNLPGVGVPEVGNPQKIDFEKINPDYLRNNPKVKGIKYWVDIEGKVWASTIDSPKEVNYADGKLNWKDEPDAQKYNIYEIVSNSAAGSVSKSRGKLKFERELTEYEVDLNGKVSVEGLSGNHYAVSAVDENGFETPPSNNLYQGYLEKDEMGEIESPPSYEYNYTLANGYNALNINFINFDGEDYYYSSPVDAFLYKMSKDNQRVLVKDTRTRFLNPYKDYIYYDMNEFYRINKNTNSIETVQQLAGETDKLSGYNGMIKDNYYYAESTYTPHTWYVFRMNLETMKVEYLTDFPVQRFIIVGDKIYYNRDTAGNYYLYRMNLDGTNKELVIADRVRNFITNGDYIFYEYYSAENKMYRTDMNGGSKILLRNQYTHNANIYKENMIVSTSTNGTYIMDKQGNIIRQLTTLGSTVHTIVILEDRIFVKNNSSIKEIDEFGNVLMTFQ